MALDEAALIAHCAQNLARYKVPAAIEIVREPSEDHRGQDRQEGVAGNGGAGT